MTLGIPAGELSDDDLTRELKHTHAKRNDTFISGSAQALATHTRRMHELELEYLTRFPDRVHDDAEKLSGA